MFVIGIDGRSGAGKTDFAARLARSGNTPVLHLEQHYAGWQGLEKGIERARTVIEAWRRGETGTASNWNWHSGTDGASVDYPPAPVWIVEGVGTGALRDLLDLLIWVECPDAVRKQRALERDGDTYAPWWDVWAAQEDDYLARVDPRAVADAVHVAE